MPGIPSVIDLSGWLREDAPAGLPCLLSPARPSAVPARPSVSPAPPLAGAAHGTHHSGAEHRQGGQGGGAGGGQGGGAGVEGEEWVGGGYQ